MKTFRLQLGPQILACHQSGGDGPPIVLLHGNSCSSRAFARLFKSSLAKNFALTALDLPGHGESTDAAIPATTYCLPGYARSVVDAVIQLGLTRALFVGWSLGGHVLLEAAPDLPEAAGFLLVATPPLGDPPDFPAAFQPHPAAALLFRREWTEPDRSAFAEAAFGPAGPHDPAIRHDLNRADGLARECLGASVKPGAYRDELSVVRGLKRPLACVIGEHDPLINRAYLDSAAMPTLWRGAVQVIPSAGHAPHWENPAAVADLLTSFAADCPGPTE